MIKYYLKRRFLILAIVVSLVFVVLAWQAWKISTNLVKDSFYQNLAYSAQTTVASFDSDRLQLLKADPSDISSDAYNFIKKRLIKINRLSDLESLYVMFIRDGQIVFSVDSYEIFEPLYSAPGDVYQEPPLELSKAFVDNKDYYTAPYTDEYGSFVSYFTPIKDDSGKLLGVLGADVDLNTYKYELWQAGLVAMIIVAIFYIISLVSLMYFEKRYYSRKALSDSEIKSRAIMEASSDSIILLNGDKQIIHINQTAEETLLYSSSELIGQDISIILGKKSSSLLERNSKVMMDLKVSDKRGATLYMELMASFANIDGNKFFIVFLHSLENRLKREEEINKQKNYFEKLNNAMIGRELKMVELKNEIRRLKENQK